MSSDETYLETFIEDLSTLPSEVKRNLELMRVMDGECSSLLSRLREAECAFLHRAEETLAGIKLPPDDAPLRCKAKVKTVKTEDGTSVRWYMKVSEEEWNRLKSEEEERKKKEKAVKGRDEEEDKQKHDEGDGDDDDEDDDDEEMKESSDEEDWKKSTAANDAGDDEVEDEEEGEKPRASNRRSPGRKRRRSSGRASPSAETKTEVAKKRRRKRKDDNDDYEEDEDTKVSAKRSPRKKAKRRGRTPKRKMYDEDDGSKDENENESDDSDNHNDEEEEGRKGTKKGEHSKRARNLSDEMDDDVDEGKSASDKKNAKDAPTEVIGDSKGRRKGGVDHAGVASKSGKGGDGADADADKSAEAKEDGEDGDDEEQEELEEFVLSKEDLRSYVPLTEQFSSAIWEPAAMEHMAQLRRDVRQRAEEKVAVAEQTYALVDETVKRLDRDLEKFEELLKGSGAFEATTGGAKPNDLAAIQVTPNSQDWILAKVISQDQETGMYKLADEDVESNKVYNLPESQVVVLGGVDRLSRGDAIYAVYPDTTSFYQASVAQPPRKVSGGESFVMVNFKDDADERGITHDKAVLMKHVMRVPYGVLA